jgi:hypothetical protein
MSKNACKVSPPVVFLAKGRGTLVAPLITLERARASRPEGSGRDVNRGS